MAVAPRSRLPPLPPPRPAGDPPRNGGSRLEARRWTAPAPDMSHGSVGTGGADGSTGLFLLGDGARNERSVMDPELECRRSRPGCWLPLPCEDSELFRAMRFVMVSPTWVGGVACVRRAAAAAAEDREALDSRSRMKAFVAASEADWLAGVLEACMGIGGQQAGEPATQAAGARSSVGRGQTKKGRTGFDVARRRRLNMVGNEERVAGAGPLVQARPHCCEG